MRTTTPAPSEVRVPVRLLAGVPFGERFVAGYKAPSTVDYLLNAPFSE